MKEQILEHLKSGKDVTIHFKKRVGGWDGKFNATIANEPGMFKSTLVSIDEIGLSINLGWLDPKMVMVTWGNVKSIDLKKD